MKKLKAESGTHPARMRRTKDWAATALAGSAAVTAAGRRTGASPQDRGRSRPDFTLADPLNLRGHPDVIARSDMRQAAGGPAVSRSRMDLAEQRLARFLGMDEALLAPSRDVAFRSVIAAHAGRGDHILIDALAPRALIDAANASGASVHRFPHGWTECVANRLASVRLVAPSARILVVAEVLSGFDAVHADIAALQLLCRRTDARLALDVTNDLGLMGRTGRGVAEIQEMVGVVDILFGALNGTFAVPCGFLAMHRGPEAQAARQARSMPVARHVLADAEADLLVRCLDIVQGDHGAWRRARLISNAIRLRDGLIAEGFKLPGIAGPTVIVLLDDALSAALSNAPDVTAHGAVAATSYQLGNRRIGQWRLSVRADHTCEDIDTMVGILCRMRAGKLDPSALSNNRSDKAKTEPAFIAKGWGKP